MFCSDDKITPSCITVYTWNIVVYYCMYGVGAGRCLQVRGCFVLTPKLLRKAKEKMVILHPLPRIDEIRYKSSTQRERESE